MKNEITNKTVLNMDKETAEKYMVEMTITHIVKMTTAKMFQPM